MDVRTYYAIEIIGHGTRAKYVIKEIESCFGTFCHARPVSRPFRTEAAARLEASALGLVISAVGPYYEII